MKNLPLMQGGLDGLCGIYSVCNVHKIINNASDSDIESLFSEIISFLSKKRMLKEIIIGGMLHKNMSDVLWNCVGDRFYEKSSNFKWSSYHMDSFWQYSMDYLLVPNSAIILSIGGKYNHYSVVNRMTENTMFLYDSSGMKRINKSSYRLFGYEKNDKYIIYPSQCWFIRGEQKNETK